MGAILKNPIQQVNNVICDLLLTKPHIGYFLTLMDIRDSFECLQSHHFLINTNILWVDYSLIVNMSPREIKNSFITLYNEFVRKYDIPDTIASFISYAYRKALIVTRNKNYAEIKYEIGYHTEATPFEPKIITLDTLLALKEIDMVNAHAKDIFTIAISLAKILKNNNLHKEHTELLNILKILPLRFQMITLREIPTANLINLISNHKDSCKLILEGLMDVMLETSFY